MLHAQAEAQSKIQDQKLEATIVEADMASSVVWFSAASGDLSHHRRMVGRQLGDRMADHANLEHILCNKLTTGKICCVLVGCAVFLPRVLTFPRMECAFSKSVCLFE